MKKAKIYSKNPISGLTEYEGVAILGCCLDKRETRGFYELRLEGEPIQCTCCRWVDNSDIEEVEEQ